MASCVSPRVSLRTLPISRVMSREYSSLRSDQHLGGAEDDFGAARGRDQAPLGEGAFGGFDRRVHVGLAGLLEDRRPLRAVSAGLRSSKVSPVEDADPLAVNEVLNNLSSLPLAIMLRSWLLYRSP